MTGPEIRLYNTLTRNKEVFAPFDPANVRLYVCGPTVYDFAHIGNARPVIVFDVLFRLLRHIYGPEHVTYVRNITDVDDKINARALRDYPGLPLNEAIRRVTETTAAQFHKDVAALGCLAPTVEPRATDNIEQMIVLIRKLMDRGNAYCARGEEGLEILFDVASMPEYGGLSKRNLDEQQAGARIAEKDHKKNPGDFVLWKESAADQPGWEGTFTISKANRKTLGLNDDSATIHGRPGWHIECSAMSERYLWTEIESRLSSEAHAHPHQFDIHGGGLDLIFPHHENEIAQSRSAHGTPTMAQVWMHNGFLQVEGQKMSKSLGNFVTINELLETKKFGGTNWLGEILRLAMLMTNYREPIDFSLARLRQADDILVQWSFIYDYIVEPLNFPSLEMTNAQVDEQVVEALVDDLNTHRAILRLQTLAGETRRGRRKLPDFLAALDLVGLKPLRPANLAPESKEQRELFELANSQIAARLEALAAKDFATADAIRAELLAKGIQLMDTKDPATGARRTKWEIKR